MLFENRLDDPQPIRELDVTNQPSEFDPEHAPDSIDQIRQRPRLVRRRC